jgi:hypothetical protein
MLTLPHPGVQETLPHINVMSWLKMAQKPVHSQKYSTEAIL